MDDQEDDQEDLLFRAHELMERKKSNQAKGGIFGLVDRIPVLPNEKERLWVSPLNAQSDNVSV
jgi:hypothetical protein